MHRQRHKDMGSVDLNIPDKYAAEVGDEPQICPVVGDGSVASVTGLSLSDPHLLCCTSIEVRIELKTEGWINSVRTVDSLKGDYSPSQHVGSLRTNYPTLDYTGDPSVTDDSSQTGSLAIAGDLEDKGITSRSAHLESINNDCDDIANFVNFHKFLVKDSSSYYYSQANKNVRNKLEKFKPTKSAGSSVVDFDNSDHGRASILSQRYCSSAYRGPQQRKNDGSTIKPSIKSRRVSESSIVGSLETELNNTNRNVSFSSVHIREYERIAGDNPSVTSGVPLSIGWKSIQFEPIDIEYFEKSKGSPREKGEMKVPTIIRKQMLHDSFRVTDQEIKNAIKSVHVVKNQRRRTEKYEHNEAFVELMQSAKRNFGRLLRRTSSEQEQKKLWTDAHKAAMQRK